MPAIPAHHEALAFIANAGLPELLQAAAASRDQGHGRNLS